MQGSETDGAVCRQSVQLYVRLLFVAVVVRRRQQKLGNDLFGPVYLLEVKKSVLESKEEEAEKAERVIRP